MGYGKRVAYEMTVMNSQQAVLWLKVEISPALMRLSQLLGVLQVRMSHGFNYIGARKWSRKTDVSIRLYGIRMEWSQIPLKTGSHHYIKKPTNNATNQTITFN